jgi:hypothetical protein
MWEYQRDLGPIKQINMLYPNNVITIDNISAVIVGRHFYAGRVKRSAPRSGAALRGITLTTSNQTFSLNTAGQVFAQIFVSNVQSEPKKASFVGFVAQGSNFGWCPKLGNKAAPLVLFSLLTPFFLSSSSETSRFHFQTV